MSPARLPESQKQAQGTARPDRIPEPRLLHLVKGEIEAAQAALARAERQAVIESATLAREGTKVKTKDRRALSKTRAHPSVAKLDRAQKEVEKYKRLLPLLAEELGRAEKIAAAAAAALPIRPGLENFGVREVESADPPLNDEEQLEWLRIGPHTDLEAAERRKAAGLPPSPPPAPGTDFMSVFIKRLRENEAAGFSTTRSRQILADHEAKRQKD